MKVIMIKDVGGVGRRGTAVEVSDGYALNNLIPRGLAVQATPQKLKELEASLARDAASSAAREKTFAEQAKKLEGSRVVVKARANDTGTLFKQISAEYIVAGIREGFGIDIPPEAILLNAPIKQVGDNSVRIKLGESAATITVEVIAVH